MSSIEEIQNIFGYISINEVETPKLTLQHLQRISPLLTENNYMTYQLFLQCRPDLSDDERAYYEERMKELKEEEDKNVKELLKIFTSPQEKTFFTLPF